eukprot:COSAG05_NODE_3008_length_2418_cov_2.248383_1_plen_183_part_00
MQQGQLEIRELKEQLAATASAAAAEAAAHKPAHEEQMELARQFRAKAEVDAAAAALYLQEALDGKAAAAVPSILGDESPVQHTQSRTAPTADELEALDEHLDGDATSDDGDDNASEGSQLHGGDDDGIAEDRRRPAVDDAPKPKADDRAETLGDKVRQWQAEADAAEAATRHTPVLMISSRC